MPTTFARTDSSFEKLTVTISAPSTTWKFVTMWPDFSITKPEPSERVLRGNGSNGSDASGPVASTCTTPLA